MDPTSKTQDTEIIKGAALEYNNMKDSESRSAGFWSIINTTLFPVAAQIIHCKYSRTRKKTSLLILWHPLPYLSYTFSISVLNMFRRKDSLTVTYRSQMLLSL